MLLSETHISRLVPEKTFLRPIKSESTNKIVSTTLHHLKVFSEATFEIKHFIEEETIVEIKKIERPMLLPEPPVAFLKPKKFDYF